jgi:hypothetical protein
MSLVVMMLKPDCLDSSIRGKRGLYLCDEFFLDAAEKGLEYVAFRMIDSEKMTSLYPELFPEYQFALTESLRPERLEYLSSKTCIAYLFRGNGDAAEVAQEVKERFRGGNEVSHHDYDKNINHVEKNLVYVPDKARQATWRRLLFSAYTF